MRHFFIKHSLIKIAAECRIISDLKTYFKEETIWTTKTY